MSLTLDNSRVYVEIEPERGRIVRLGHRPLGVDLVRETRLTENFRLLVPLHPGELFRAIRPRRRRARSADADDP